MNPIPAARIVIPAEDRREILERIDEALRTGALTLGRNGEAFETAFARVVGARFAVAVQSGTSALEIVLRALDVDGCEVIVPTNTFFATPAAVIHAGGRQRFADVESATMGLSVDTVAAAVSSETPAVILVHIGGMVSPDAPKIAAFCRDHHLILVEDVAHAHASSLDGCMAGTFGTAAAFSFYPTKAVTAGEGGMIVTDDQEIYRLALQYRDQGKEGFLTNFHVRLGQLATERAACRRGPVAAGTTRGVRRRATTRGRHVHATAHRSERHRAARAAERITIQFLQVPGVAGSGRRPIGPQASAQRAVSGKP